MVSGLGGCDTQANAVMKTSSPPCKSQTFEEPNRGGRLFEGRDKAGEGERVKGD